MHVDRIPNRTSPLAFLLRETYREGGKVKKHTLANITHWPAGKISALRRLLRDEWSAPKPPSARPVREHDDACICAQVQIPELVTGRDRRDEQVLGAPAGRVAAETRIGRSQNVGLARRADRVRALIAPCRRQCFRAFFSSTPRAPVLANDLWVPYFAPALPGAAIFQRFTQYKLYIYARHPSHPSTRGYTAVRRCDGIRWTIPKTVMCRSSISWTMLTWRRLQGRSASGGEAAWDARCASRVTFAEGTHFNEIRAPKP
jgi:hypothetical protein